MDDLNDWAERVHSLAENKGWWETRTKLKDGSYHLGPDELITTIALIMTEASEAIECVRLGQLKTQLRLDGKPEGLPSELADVLIRTLDLCAALGVDVEAEVTLKHEFNRSRKRRHGGKLA